MTDLLYIKKRILDKSEFRYATEATFAPRLFMKCYNFEVSTAIRLSEVEDLKSNGSDIEFHIKEILVNEFIANTEFLNKFIKLENREKNLNELIKD